MDTPARQPERAPRLPIVARLLMRLIPLIAAWLVVTHLVWVAVRAFLIEPLGIGTPGGPPIISIAWLIGVLFVVRWVPILLLLVRVAPRWGARLERAEQARRGVPVCVRCGYHAGAPVERCPECGQGMAKPKAEALGVSSP